MKPLSANQAKFWRTSSMVGTTFLKIAFVCIASLASGVAAAQVSDVDLLTCNFAKVKQPFPSASWDHLHFREAPDGTFVVPGPVQEKELCIQNATIAGSFGMYMVTAELCNSTTQPLFDWLAENRPLLQRTTAKTQPGIIAFFGTEKDGLSVFYGRASNHWKQDPTKRQLSFACSVAGSVAQ